MVLFLILQMQRIYALVNGHILPRYVEYDGEYDTRLDKSKLIQNLHILYNWNLKPFQWESNLVWIILTLPKWLQKKCLCTCILYHLHNRIRDFGVAPSSTFFGSIELLNLCHKSALFWFKFNFVNWILHCKPLQLPKNWTLN